LIQLAKAMQCTSQGGSFTTQTGYNYIVDNFFLDENHTTLPLPYAVDMCNPTSMLPSSSFVKYTCGNTSGVATLTKTQYSNSGCTRSGKVVDSWLQGESAEGEVGYFQCGQQDGYVELLLSNTSDCSSENSQTVYFGLGGCGTNINYSIQFSCTSTQTVIQVFLDLNVPPPGLSSSSGPVPFSSSSTPFGGGNGGGGGTPVVCQLSCDQVTVGSTCGSTFPGFAVYGQMESCSAGSTGGGSSTTTTTRTATATTTTAKPGGSASLFTLNCFLLALVGTLFLF